MSVRRQRHGFNSRHTGNGLDDTDKVLSQCGLSASQADFGNAHFGEAAHEIADLINGKGLLFGFGTALRQAVKATKIAKLSNGKSEIGKLPLKIISQHLDFLCKATRSRYLSRAQVITTA